jgi:hypothetical protein
MTNAVPFLMKMSEVIGEIMSGVLGLAGANLRSFWRWTGKSNTRAGASAERSSLGK